MLGDSSSSAIATTATTSSGGLGGGEAPPASRGATHHHHHHQHEGSSTEAGGEDDGGRGDVNMEGGDRGFGGNRWPRQETLALLKIRSDMDVAFRDASVKGPLWEEVSRKLAELGYSRSAKKCKEKFENVYKYHRRTKESRTGKQEGKTYKFFDQLEAFESHPPSLPTPTPPQKPQTPAAATTMPVVNPPPQPANVVTVPSTTMPTMSQGNVIAPRTAINFTVAANPPPSNIAPSSFPTFSSDLMSDSTSSSTSSDLELHQGGRRRRKRKWKDFFDRLMKEVMQKQEEMQRRFLEAIEKKEHERLVKEESWRMQEIARINREREILAQERSIAAAKDAAMMAFLQKLSEQHNVGQVTQNNPSPPPPVPIVAPTPTIASGPPPTPPPVPVAPAAAAPPAQLVTNFEALRSDNNGDLNFMPTSSSSRWPKVEVQALIKLRTSLDSKYDESGPKGPLWEEISAGMRKLGYNRNAKRCKEKWENINKYFKKVKESNKKRPQDSKTCPYYDQLDALYKERSKTETLKPENSVPLMVRPEQQWPPPPPAAPAPDHQEHGPDSADMESDDHQNQDDDKDNDDDEEEEDEAGGYELVANKPASISTNE